MVFQLLSRKSPFEFPGDRLSGFDSAHVGLTSNGICRFSGIAQDKGFVNLLTGLGPDSVGATPTASIKYTIPGVNGSAAGLTFTTGVNLVSEPAYLFAAMVFPTTGSVASDLFGFGVPGTNGYAIRNTAGSMFATRTAASIQNGIAYTAGVPYFLAIGRLGTTTNLGFAFTRRLDNGITAQANFTTTTAETAPTEFRAASGNPVVGAVAYIHPGITSMLPLFQMLRKWSEDPWSFWYPRTRPIIIGPRLTPFSVQYQRNLNILQTGP